MRAAADGQQRVTLGVDSESPTGVVSIYQRAGFETVHSWISYRMPLDRPEGRGDDGETR